MVSLCSTHPTRAYPSSVHARHRSRWLQPQCLDVPILPFIQQSSESHWIGRYLMRCLLHYVMNRQAHFSVQLVYLDIQRSENFLGLTHLAQSIVREGMVEPKTDESI